MCHQRLDAAGGTTPPPSQAMPPTYSSALEAAQSLAVVAQESSGHGQLYPTVPVHASRRRVGGKLRRSRSHSPALDRRRGRSWSPSHSSENSSEEKSSSAHSSGVPQQEGGGKPPPATLHGATDTILALPASEGAAAPDSDGARASSSAGPAGSRGGGNMRQQYTEEWLDQAINYVLPRSSSGSGQIPLGTFCPELG